MNFKWKVTGSISLNVNIDRIGSFFLLYCFQCFLRIASLWSCHLLQWNWVWRVSFVCTSSSSSSSFSFSLNGILLSKPAQSSYPETTEWIQLHRQYDIFSVYYNLIILFCVWEMCILVFLPRACVLQFRLDWMLSRLLCMWVCLCVCAFLVLVSIHLVFAFMFHLLLSLCFYSRSAHSIPTVRSMYQHCIHCRFFG